MKITALLIISMTYMMLGTAVSAASGNKVNNQPPASVVELTILSQQQRMPGLAYLARGHGPHPTAVLLHGYPGNEKNLDVAQDLRRQGWNTVFFHYRGAWGAEGEFSFLNAEQDVQAVIQYLQAQENARKLRVDPAQISLIGHSMGGHMALAGLLDNPSVRCAVSYDGANLGAGNKGFLSSPESASLWMDYSDTLFMLSGWSGAKMQQEVLQHAAHLNLVNRASQAKGRPIMMIVADTDVIPIDEHITPLRNALNNDGATNVSYHLLSDDHSFSNTRPRLSDLTYEFIDGNCRD
ncbi:hypothetical protein GCM10008090_15630 [Arenicella chitinivorans]|uniref:BD-FAE-like domain-containing protein n=1 Tax=Arenicella chitinivorans TaxID=1329800 RepID=A0A918RNH5_9GAMM|nr:alpha/beta fold hydrolase [Arenicella chitinivorans]GHA06821.1 hypothetical protein GCM10008090_15630 [Arenicella chitinivorans]